MVLMTLMILGLPAVASAHGGAFDDESSVAISASATSSPEAREISAPKSAEHFLESAGAPAQTRHCRGSCCCQGISHCSSSCGSALSALNAGAPLVFDARVVRINVFGDQVVKHLDPAFGLERPPKG